MAQEARYTIQHSARVARELQNRIHAERGHPLGRDLLRRLKLIGKVSFWISLAKFERHASRLRGSKRHALQPILIFKVPLLQTYAATTMWEDVIVAMGRGGHDTHAIGKEAGWTGARSDNMRSVAGFVHGMRVDVVEGVEHGARWRRWVASSTSTTEWEVEAMQGCSAGCGVIADTRHVMLGECEGACGTGVYH